MTKGIDYDQHVAGRRLDSHHDPKPSPFPGFCYVCRFATTQPSSGLLILHHPTETQLPHVDAWLAAHDQLDEDEDDRTS